MMKFNTCFFLDQIDQTLWVVSLTWGPYYKFKMAAQINQEFLKIISETHKNIEILKLEVTIFSGKLFLENTRF